DADGSRREAVRRKTAQYLQRAEQLVARLTRKEKKKDQDYIDGIGIEAKDGGELGLQFHASDLQRYRVAGSAGSVIIATDTFNGDTVAIKVLFKSGGGSGEKTIIPQNVPYMVPIIRYHETQSAIYLVLKFISGGKLWSHISKYVKEVCTDPSDMFETTSNNTYAGRRFLLENEDCDGPAADCSSLCETPSLISNVSLLQSHNPPATAGNLLSVPDRMSVGGCSTCSDASSSSCMPEGYLPIYTEYSPTLPSSSSMVVIPPIGNHVTQVTDSVPKSISAEALIMSSECAEENHEIERGHSAADEKKNREGNNDDANVDNASIGSDTLSGVSEDFSCSLPPNVPSLLPDPLPLPEVRITSCQAGIDVIASQEFETSEYEYPDLVKGCSDETEVVCLGEKDQLCDKDKHFQDTERCFENEDRKYVCDVDKRVDAGSPDANLKVVDDEKEDISVTDTSFASITLPTFSWTKKEDSELASLDIEDLIRNSKKLLINVDHTLQQSKSQSIVTFNDSDDSASVDHSELPYDSVSCDQLDKSKGGYRVLKNSTGNLSECVNAKQATSVFDTKTAQLEIDICNKLGDNTNISKCDIGNDVQDSQCKSVGTDMEDRSRNKHESSKCENLKENCCSSSMSRTIEESCVFAKDNEPKERQSPSNMGSNKCSLKDRLTPNYCQEPLENSIGTLLEQYSASHGHDTRPRLPEGIVKVWSSQILSALTSLHQLGVIWGDFNPDNVLLDEGGSILVTYESRWSSVQHNIRGGRGWKMNGMEIGCKWKRYLAPELESPLTYPSVASDWWSVGALMYHMLTGQSLSGAHPSGITSHTEISLPSHLSTEAASLLTQLLCTHPTERLGGGVAGAQEIKDHAFFTGIQWTD
ncbi:Ribosomal protein S6 kinase delta-1, partial [Halocaridina rubra]